MLHCTGLSHTGSDQTLMESYLGDRRWGTGIPGRTSCDGESSDGRVHRAAPAPGDSFASRLYLPSTVRTVGGARATLSSTGHAWVTHGAQETTLFIFTVDLQPSGF